MPNPLDDIGSCDKYSIQPLIDNNTHPDIESTVKSNVIKSIIEKSVYVSKVLILNFITVYLYRNYLNSKSITIFNILLHRYDQVNKLFQIRKFKKNVPSHIRKI